MRLSLMAADVRALTLTMLILSAVGCGRLGYDERARTPQARPDAGAKPASDEDAGEP